MKTIWDMLLLVYNGLSTHFQAQNSLFPYVNIFLTVGKQEQEEEKTFLYYRTSVHGLYFLEM